MSTDTTIRNYLVQVSQHLADGVELAQSLSDFLDDCKPMAKDPDEVMEWTKRRRGLQTAIRIWIKSI